MDDFLDLIDTLLAADTYDSVGRPIYRGADLLKNAGAAGFAKGSGVVTWGIRGVDAVIDEIGIELDPAVRAQLKAEVAQAKSGFFTGELLPPTDEQGNLLNVSIRATDGTGGARDPDLVKANTYDP